MLYTRLDTLETVDINDPLTSKRVLYGVARSSALVKASGLWPQPHDNRVPYLRLYFGSKWAVRLIPQDDLSTRAAQLAYLSARDGWTCFYCSQSINEHTATVEHIVCTAHQGPTHADNLCLSCSSCNAAVGHLPAVQKVKLAISVRVGTIAATVFKDQQRRSNDAARKRGTK